MKYKSLGFIVILGLSLVTHAIFFIGNELLGVEDEMITYSVVDTWSGDIQSTFTSRGKAQNYVNTHGHEFHTYEIRELKVN